MIDERRMAGGHVEPMSFGPMQIGHRFRHAHPDADALKIGQRHDARNSPMIFLADHRQRGAKRHRAPRHKATKHRAARLKLPLK